MNKVETALAVVGLVLCAAGLVLLGLAPAIISGRWPRRWRR